MRAVYPLMIMMSLSGCGNKDNAVAVFSTMKPNASIKVGDTEASIAWHQPTGDYIVTWTSAVDDERAMILVQTDLDAELRGEDVIAVAQLPPFVWTPPDPDTTYRVTVMPTGGKHVHLFTTDADPLEH